MFFRVFVVGCFALMPAGQLSCTRSTKSMARASPPSITAEPANQTVKVGQTTSFTVAATGTALLSYQWQKNGARSPSYTTSSDPGAQFTVVVSNSAGSVASNAAMLTVNAAAANATAVRLCHVAFLVEENANHSGVTSSSMPYLFGLISNMARLHSITLNAHPSISNYFMLTTGQTLTNDDRQTPSSFPLSVDNVGEITTAGKTWKAMPKPCRRSAISAATLPGEAGVTTSPCSPGLPHRRAEQLGPTPEPVRVLKEIVFRLLALRRCVVQHIH
jgi:hypothetical protein